MRKIIALALLSILCLGACTKQAEKQDQLPDMYQLKKEFIDLRFGMFICYNIMSYGAQWGEANYPLDSFFPQQLDCSQWADAAALAGMKFGLLTTKHHEGFCLWDSEYTEYDVASTPLKRDVVREYVDAFREKDMKIGLYYSIWDSSQEIEPGMIDAEKMDFVKGQIRELLSNYGKIDYFVVDGWFWKMGHEEISFHEIRELIRELQPGCLLTDHTHMHAPYHVDIPYFEGPFGAFPGENNQMASALGHCSLKGNGWFWSPATPDGMKLNDGVDVVLEKLGLCEARYCNFMLNCMPNRDGLLDTIYLEMLSEIGDKWKPDEERRPLPDPGRELVLSYPIKTASASSGDASQLFDGRKIPGGPHSTWVSDSLFPQEIVIDMGEIREIDVLMLVPDHRVKPAPEMALAEGNVGHCKLWVSLDEKQWEPVAEQKWKPDALYRTIGFEPRQARFLKLEILDALGTHAKIATLDVGRSTP